jgi:ribosomal protein S12 methylthiotransferase accessory factor
MSTLATRCSNQELKDGLERSEKVVYTDNGNRAIKASTALRRIMPVLSLAGIARLAEISQLTRGSFPVFQSSRPGILLHSSTGQNTGAQGKGRTPVQAKISCVMETLENVCMEPRNESLIRGTYAFLRGQHAIVPPWLFALQRGVAKPTAKEPFMWTQALLLGTDEPVLLPAEHVYFPFLPRDYGTRPTFTSTSNGVAAGSTYLEAAIHALYEVIERHYCALWDAGKIRASAFMCAELDAVPHIRQFRDATRGEFDMEILALRMPGLKNLPMFVCWLLRRDGAWLYGSGCAPEFNMAIHRAVSEAVQAWAVLASGTREDLSEQCALTSLKNFPRTQTLTRKDYLKTAHDRCFDNLREEFCFLASWLKSAGFPIITIANLTRHGLNIPVVRAIVPGLAGNPSRSHGLDCTTLDIHRQRFSYKRPSL